MLGFEVAQSTVSKYTVRRRKPPSQTWKTFLRNHAEAIAAIEGLIKEANSFVAAQFEKRSLADEPARRKVPRHDVQQSSDKWPVLILSRRASS